MKALTLALIIGLAPMVLAFLAGFFGATVGVGWPVYIGWFVVCLIVGVTVAIVRR